MTLEERIDRAYEQMLAAPTVEEKRAFFRTMTALIRERSVERVAEMEKNISGRTP